MSAQCSGLREGWGDRTSCLSPQTRALRSVLERSRFRREGDGGPDANEWFRSIDRTYTFETCFGTFSSASLVA